VVSNSRSVSVTATNLPSFILPSKKMIATEPTKEELSTSTLQYSIEKALESKYIYKKSILHDWADDEYWNSDDEDYEEI
jgi:hypothetical protein